MTCSHGLHLHLIVVLSALCTTTTAMAQDGPLVKLVVEPPGENCVLGGTAVRSGVDTNGDGVLGDDELRNTQYVCKVPTSGGEEPEPESGADKTPPATTDTGGDRPVVPSPIGPLWQENTWDAMAELGGGVDLEDKGRFFGRIRGGLLWVREPFFISLAAMAEVGPYAPVAAGIQGEVAHLWTGLWANAGASIDLDARPAAHMAVGWSIFGAEARYQGREQGESSWALFGKLRVPIRHLVFALSR